MHRRLQQGFTTGEMGFEVSLQGTNPEPAGQKQTLDGRRLMSALPPKADIGWLSSDVRFRFIPKKDRPTARPNQIGSTVWPPRARGFFACYRDRK